MPSEFDPTAAGPTATGTLAHRERAGADPRDLPDGRLEPVSPLAVSVQDVSVTYKAAMERKPTLHSTLRALGRGQRVVREIEAVKGVSFDVTKGSAIGLIGANGAGKSTLMRTIAGILPPTRGRIEVHGRVSTLLALGVGFNRALSGRENVILGGLAAGLSRPEVEDRYQQIAEFAELGDFVDMPMRTYSSGMFSRLAFSVAVHLDPDILLVDEALSTGDAHFREKSLDKMKELCTGARAIFLVSHGLGTIAEMCSDVIWLNKGELVMRGDAESVTKEYRSFLKLRREERASVMEEV